MYPEYLSFNKICVWSQVMCFSIPIPALLRNQHSSHIQLYITKWPKQVMWTSVRDQYILKVLYTTAVPMTKAVTVSDYLCSILDFTNRTFLWYLILTIRQVKMNYSRFHNIIADTFPWMRAVQSIQHLSPC